MAREALPSMQSEARIDSIRDPGAATVGLSVILLIIVATFATALTAFFFVHWSPVMPTAGLDPSWRYAINEAVARHVMFGRDFTWTFGPFGMVYTGLYHPATDRLMLTGSIIVVIGLCVGFATLVWPRRIYLLPLLPIIVAEVSLPDEVSPPDTVFMALPFLLLLVTFRLSVPRANRLHVPLRGSVFLGVAVLSCAVGVLPLIKGSFLALVAVEGGTAILLAFVARQRALAFGILLFVIAPLCIGWIASGQPLSALPRYFWAEEQLIAGYSQAMSVHGLFIQLLYWGVPAAVITVTFCARVTRQGGLAGWLVFLGFAFYLFVAFKEGFVRQDVHVHVSGEALLFVGLFLAALLQPRWAIGVAVMACLGWVAIEGSMVNFSAATALARIENRAHGAVRGIMTRVGSPGELPATFTRANAAIQADSPLPSVKGTVDLYPYDLALLFGAGMKWDGRPVIQSYSAYTPALMEANAKHLLGNDAPANIFFAVQPIDGRLPALEDASSWPLLLSRYSIIGFHGNYLQMVRSAHPAPVRFDRPALRVGVRLNKWIDVPSGGGLLWAHIDMRPTVLGKLALAAFKLPRVSIELQLADGRTERYRYIPEMGRAGFLLSPVVTSTVDFALVSSGQDKGAEVRKLRLLAPETGLWPRRVHLSIRKLDIPAQRGVRGLVLTEPRSPPGVLTSQVSQPEDCSLGTTNGQLFGSLQGPIVLNDDRVSISGWTAPDAQRGIGPDETWLELKSANGELRYYRARMMSRPDVLAYFKQPKMKDPGFSADLDLVGLSGTQKLTIYSTHDNETYRCPTQAMLQLPPQ